MLIPAPNDAANPTRNAAWVLRVANAAANTGARVETDPSIRPARPGCTIWSTNSRRLARSSSSLTWDAVCPRSIPGPGLHAFALFELGRRAVVERRHPRLAPPRVHESGVSPLRWRWPDGGRRRGPSVARAK